MIKLKKPKFFYKNNNINYIAIALLLITLFYLLGFYLIKFFKSLKKSFIFENKAICIGNFVVGGAGKTPIVIAIVEYLKNRNINSAIISKGYGRKSNKEIAIPCQSKRIFDAKETGDEPLLLSDFADTFVVNKRDKILFDLSSYKYLIFDDGLQDYSFKSDIKIAVFDCNFFIGNGFCLPNGPLRELLFLGMKKIDFAILLDFNDKDNDKIEYLSKYISKDKILKAKLEIIGSYDKNFEYCAFSGIGDNWKFFNTLKKYRINVLEIFEFNDHYNYSDKDIEKIIDFAEAKNLKIITTEKDFCKINSIYQEKIICFKIKYTIDQIEKIFST